MAFRADRPSGEDRRGTNQRWATNALALLEELKVRPIAGLLHHGSGPSYTSLLDPEFPTQLAAYAKRVAARYPFIDAYTPVNEPNTTARFSGMYGVWYPHHLSKTSYLRALLHQLEGTVLSMQEIRRIRPDAQLVQTEDCGSICGTEELRPVWEVLNLRRWLTFDLLYGRVDRCHAMFDYMRLHGIPDGDILWFADHPCPPDIIGVNYYATSDRFIDGRVELYSPDRMSAEGAFVDVEAVRVKGATVSGFDSLLVEVWRRYRTPVAITEVHLGGSIDEQIRWAAYAWGGMKKAQGRGARCAAITFWSLLGSYYWNQLVRQWALRARRFRTERGRTGRDGVGWGGPPDRSGQSSVASSSILRRMVDEARPILLHGSRCCACGVAGCRFIFCHRSIKPSRHAASIVMSWSGLLPAVARPIRSRGALGLRS